MSEIEEPPWIGPEQPVTSDDLREDWNPTEEATGDSEPLTAVRDKRLAELQWRKSMGTVLTEEELAELGRLEVPLWMQDVKTFAERLEEGIDPVCYRVEGISLCDGNTLLHAPYKTGKTVLMGNLTRSLVDGEDFLDAFAVEPLDGVLVYLNRELLREQFDEWLAAQRIHRTDKVVPVYLRGRGAHPQDDDDAAYLVELLRKVGAEAVVDDTLTTSLLPGSDPNQGAVASSFTNRWDEIKAEAGVRDLFLPSHTGHVTRLGRGGIPLGLHTRGHSMFMDWSDATWSYAADTRSVRHLSVTGRLKHDLPATPLAYDRDTMRLAVDRARTAERSAKDESRARIKDQVAELIRESTGRGEPITKRSIRAVEGDSSIKDQVTQELVDEGLIEVQDGQRGALLHWWIEDEK